MEGDYLTLMEQVQSSLETITDTPNCLLDREALRTTRELLQVRTEISDLEGEILMFFVLSHREILTAATESNPMWRPPGVTCSW